MVTAPAVVPPEVGVKNGVWPEVPAELESVRVTAVPVLVDRVAELVLDLDGEGADAGGGADGVAARDRRGEGELAGQPRHHGEAVRAAGDRLAVDRGRGRVIVGLPSLVSE